MAAFVVVPLGSDLPVTGTQLNIFPGSATPSVFSAEEPFWIGYGFVAEAESTERFDRDARFGSRWTARRSCSSPISTEQTDATRRASTRSRTSSPVSQLVGTASWAAGNREASSS